MRCQVWISSRSIWDTQSNLFVNAWYSTLGFPMGPFASCIRFCRSFGHWIPGIPPLPKWRGWSGSTWRDANLSPSRNFRRLWRRVKKDCSMHALCLLFTAADRFSTGRWATAQLQVILWVVNIAVIVWFARIWRRNAAAYRSL